MERTAEKQPSGKRVREDDGEEFLLGRRALLGRHLHVRLLRQASYEQQLLRQQEREMMAYLQQQQQQEQAQRLLQSLQFPSLVLNDAARAREAVSLAQRAVFLHDMLSQSSQVPARSPDTQTEVVPNSDETIKALHSSKGKPTDAVTSFSVSSPQTAAAKRGIPLFLSSDKETLSGYQILVRKSLEFFTADAEDASTNVQGRKKKIQVGQVGIRCRYCAELPIRSRGRGAIYYPLKLSGVYQAAQNISVTHLSNVCIGIPQKDREELNLQHELQRRDANTGGKAYWVSSCREIGLEEHETGLWFKSGTALLG